MNRRAAFTPYEVAMWIIRMFFLVIVLFSVIFIVTAFVKTEVNVQDAQTRVFFSAFWYSPDGVAYEDSETGRAFPGMVDGAKLALEMESAFSDNNGNIIAARFRAADQEGFYYKDSFERWEVLAEANLVTGLGGVHAVKSSRAVALRTGTDVHTELLNTTIITQNS